MLELDERKTTHALLFFLTVFTVGTVCLAFKDTPFYFNGLIGDASLHSAILTKISAGEFFADGSYKGLHNFYPPLYHFLASFIALIMGAPAYAGLKYMGALSYAFAIIPSYLLWRKVGLDRTRALWLIATMTFIFPIIYKPFEFISVMLFVPWWIWAFEKGLRHTTRDYIVLSILGGLIFLMYYYWFLVLGLHFVIQCCRWKFNRADAKSALTILLGTAVVAAPFWIPLLSDICAFPVRSLNNRWFRPEHIRISLLVFKLENFFLWSGITAFYFHLKKRRTLHREISEIMVSCAMFYILGTLFLFLGAPILHLRVLHIAQVLLMLALASALHGFFTRNFVLISAVTILLMSLAFIEKHFVSTWRGAAIAQKDLPATYRALIGKQERLEGRVLLTNDVHLPSFVNTNLFIHPYAHFSHPASRYEERLRFLLSSEKKSSEEMCEALRDNAYDAVDYLYFNPRLKHFRLYDDNFPYGIRRRPLDLQKWMSLPCLLDKGDGLFQVVGKKKAAGEAAFQL